jgi:hypothetical protein
MFRAIILMKQDDDDTDWEISNDQSEDLEESTLSSEIEKDDLDNHQEIQHLDLARRDKTIQTTCVRLPKKRSRADTFIARAPLPVGAIAPPLLKCEKSAINVSHESDIVQTLPLKKAGGDQNVPQLKAGGDHKYPHHQKATFEVAKRFIEAIVFTKTPWPIISDETYSMVDQAWKLVAIEAEDWQWALAGTPVGAPCVCRLPCGPSLKIDPQT